MMHGQLVNGKICIWNVSLLWVKDKFSWHGGGLNSLDEVTGTFDFFEVIFSLREFVVPEIRYLRY